ncbi:hypothetical protein VNI00_005189 [Paramarasmius palmivorus]|uniref:Uncharacterized protein n=1 Tax=Paramarasmius palmivorus TaxID=297713 RepID=A0AAW0DHL7_9AGAR
MSPRSQRTHRSRRTGSESEDDHPRRAAMPIPSPAPSGMNLDPDAPYLGPATEGSVRDIEAQQTHSSSESDDRRFVGGFNFERLKRAVTGASIQWGAGSRRARAMENYSPPYSVNGAGPTNGLPHTHGQSIQRPSETSSSEDTFHYGPTTEEGTTAVDHTYQPQYLTAPAIGSPEFVEPLPAPDYRKMASPSPPPSNVSLHSYFSKLKKILHEFNSLPWIAEDRVTMDYYPGQSRKRVREQAPYGTAPKHRTAIATSWYGEHYRNYKPSGMLDMQELDLTAGESPEMARNGANNLHQSPPGVIQPFVDGNGQMWPAISEVMYQDPEAGFSPRQEPVAVSYTPAAPAPAPIPTTPVANNAVTPIMNMNPLTSPRATPATPVMAYAPATPNSAHLNTPRVGATVPPAAYTPRSNVTGLASPRPAQYANAVPDGTPHAQPTPLHNYYPDYYPNDNEQVWPVVVGYEHEPQVGMDTTPVIPPNAHIPDGIFASSAAAGPLR